MDNRPDLQTGWLFGVCCLGTAIRVGAPSSGRWVVVCEALSRRGRRSHKKHDAMSGSNRIMTTPKGYKYFA
jgi:hypothetical protein